MHDHGAGCAIETCAAPLPGKDLPPVITSLMSRFLVHGLLARQHDLGFLDAVMRFSGCKHLRMWPLPMSSSSLQSNAACIRCYMDKAE